MSDFVELEAITPCPYGTGIRAVGERFRASASDAKLLESLGRAKRVKADADDEPGYKTRALKSKG